MSMEVRSHAGRCCGIKNIYGMYGPSATLQERDAHKDGLNLSDTLPGNGRFDKDFFTDAAPTETYLQRFDRILAFCKKNRPSHCLEVVLANINIYEGSTCVKQDDTWGPLLKERGFKKVSTFTNSNSNHKVKVYHLTYKDGVNE